MQIGQMVVMGTGRFLIIVTVLLKTTHGAAIIHDRNKRSLDAVYRRYNATSYRVYLPERDFITINGVEYNPSYIENSSQEIDTITERGDFLKEQVMFGNEEQVHQATSEGQITSSDFTALHNNISTSSPAPILNITNAAFVEPENEEKSVKQDTFQNTTSLDQDISFSLPVESPLVSKSNITHTQTETEGNIDHSTAQKQDIILNSTLLNRDIRAFIPTGTSDLVSQIHAPNPIANTLYGSNDETEESSELYATDSTTDLDAIASTPLLGYYTEREPTYQANEVSTERNANFINNGTFDSVYTNNPFSNNGPYESNYGGMVESANTYTTLPSNTPPKSVKKPSTIRIVHMNFFANNTSQVYVEETKHIDDILDVNAKPILDNVATSESNIQTTNSSNRTSPAVGEVEVTQDLDFDNVNNEILSSTENILLDTHARNRNVPHFDTTGTNKSNFQSRANVTSHNSYVTTETSYVPIQVNISNEDIMNVSETTGREPQENLYNIFPTETEDGSQPPTTSTGSYTSMHSLQTSDQNDSLVEAHSRSSINKFIQSTDKPINSELSAVNMEPNIETTTIILPYKNSTSSNKIAVYPTTNTSANHMSTSTSSSSEQTRNSSMSKSTSELSSKSATSNATAAHHDNITSQIYTTPTNANEEIESGTNRNVSNATHNEIEQEEESSTLRPETTVKKSAIKSNILTEEQKQRDVLTIVFKCVMETSEWFLTKDNSFRKELSELLTAYQFLHHKRHEAILPEDVMYVLPGAYSDGENITVCIVVKNPSAKEQNVFLPGKYIQKCINGVQEQYESMINVSIQTISIGIPTPPTDECANAEIFSEKMRLAVGMVLVFIAFGVSISTAAFILRCQERRKTYKISAEQDSKQSRLSQDISCQKDGQHLATDEECTAMERGKRPEEEKSKGSTPSSKVAGNAVMPGKEEYEKVLMGCPGATNSCQKTDSCSNAEATEEIVMVQLHKPPLYCED